MTPEEFTRKLQAEQQAFKNWFDKDLPVIVEVEAVNHFTESFQNEGFTDVTLVKWDNVERRKNPKMGKRGEVLKNQKAGVTQKILTKSGSLGRSIEVERSGPGEVVIWTNPDAFEKEDKAGGLIKCDPYGLAHNEGTTTAGRGNRTTIPKRQFMGHSKVLEEKIMKISKVKLIYIFK